VVRSKGGGWVVVVVVVGVENNDHADVSSSTGPEGEFLEEGGGVKACETGERRRSGTKSRME